MVYILNIENPLYYHYVSTNLFFCFVELETHEFPLKRLDKIQKIKKNTVNRYAMPLPL